MHNILKLILLGSALLFACGPTDDPGDDEECPPGSEYCDGLCVVFDTHPDHCGSCGNVCPEGSNACVEGQCVCMSSDETHWSKAPCSEPAVCDETGLCLTPDALGESCDEIESIWCDDTSKVCVEGFCTLPDCDHPEICNLLDDNCDGLTDRNEPGVRLSQECYSGDASTQNIGICRPGEQECVAGTWTLCTGEQVPIPEEGLLTCDGIDNDCNNCVDDRYDEDGNLICGMPEEKPTDTVFIVDISGSMAPSITAVTTAMSGLVTMYSTATWIRWALIQVAFPTDELVKIVQPLSDFTGFLASLSSLSINGSIEPTYDAVWRTAKDDFSSPSLGLDPTAQLIIVVFTDESAQTELGLSEADVCDAMDQVGLTLAVFTKSIYFSQWDDCAITYELTSDATQMTAQLDDLFEAVCAVGL